MIKRPRNFNGLIIESTFSSVRDMASRVWEKMRANDSRECRSCHAWDSMDMSEQDRSARKRHGRARDEGKTCIDCHKGIAHEEPDEPDEEEDVAVK